MKHRALGRETPTKVVARHPNWGFIMDGCWSVACSFPLPPRGEDPSLEDAALPITVDVQQVRRPAVCCRQWAGSRDSGR